MRQITSPGKITWSSSEVMGQEMVKATNQLNLSKGRHAQKIAALEREKKRNEKEEEGEREER